MASFRKSLLDNLFGFDDPETTGERVFFRVFELWVIAVMLWLAWQWGFYLERVDRIVHPVGLGQHVDLSFLLQPGLPLVNAGLIAALLLAGYARRWRYAYALGLVLMHVQFAARFSLGKIPHGANLPGLALLGLGLAMLAFRTERRRRRFALGFAYFSVGLSYTLAAFSKLVGTGPDWVDGRHLWMWLHQKGADTFARSGVTDINTLQQLVLDHYAVATGILVMGLLTELAGVLFWWKRFRVPVGLALIGLHLGIYWTMNILTDLSIVELLFLALPWAGWLNYAGRAARLPAFLDAKQAQDVPSAS